MIRAISSNFALARFGGKFCTKNPSRSVANYKPPPVLSNVEFPPDKRKLQQVQKTPVLPAWDKPLKQNRRILDMRGPEEVHNLLIHKQFGMQATTGGMMDHRHFEMIRANVNRQLNEKRMFAIWRVDPPWKPWTKKSQGMRMGGGKGNIDKYVTPVRVDRIVFELGGFIQFAEAQRIVETITYRMPFRCRFVAQEMLNMETDIERAIQEQNLNPFNFDMAIRHNFEGCNRWLDKRAYVWGPKYR